MGGTDARPGGEFELIVDHDRLSEDEVPYPEDYAGAKGKRSALPHARLMIHQPSGGMQGSAAEIEIQAKEIVYLRTQLNSLFSKHTGRPVEQIERDMDRDNFMSAPEGKAYGLIDNVLEKADDPAAARPKAASIG